MQFRRPTTGDRMDNSNERTYRRRQSEVDLVMEKAEAAQYERDAAMGRRLHEDTQPYRGSRLESDHRSRES